MPSNLQLPNIVKQTYGDHPGTEILLFLPRLCVDIYNVDETAHYKRVFDKVMRCDTCTVQFFDGLTNAAVSRFNSTAGGIYAPLDRTSREIRLLLLQSSKGNGETPIQCKLIGVDIDNAPEFTALSYVWGNAKSRELIEVNGNPFAVTTHLGKILRHLRRDSADIFIWVDAICIYQDRYRGKCCRNLT